MPSIDCIILIILQGDKVIHEGPGFFDIRTFNKNGKTLVTIQIHTDYLEGVWFDLAVWDTALISEDEYFKTYRLTRKAS